MSFAFASPRRCLDCVLISFEAPILCNPPSPFTIALLGDMGSLTKTLAPQPVGKLTTAWYYRQEKPSAPTIDRILLGTHGLHRPVSPPRGQERNGIDSPTPMLYRGI